MAKKKTRTKAVTRKKKRMSKQRRTTRGAGAKAGRKKAGGRGGRRAGGLANASVEQLQQELDRRYQEMEQLQGRREGLLRDLEELDRQIASLGGPPDGRRRPRAGGRPRGTGATKAGGRRRRGGGRGQNEMNLVQALQQALSGRTLSVTEVAQAVQDAGYQTRSANFRTIVNQALISNPDLFKKIARGQYTAK